MPAHPVDLSGLTVGDIRLTLVPDGYHRCEPRRTFSGSTAADWDAHPELLDDTGRVVMTLGSLLVELPSGERVLVDLAFGNRSLVLADLAMDFWGGRLLRNLARVGLRPEDIDLVVFSHLHIDHIGWTLDATREQLCFPNARHVMAGAEWDHWRTLGTPEAPPERIFAALEDRIELLGGETTLLP